MVVRQLITLPSQLQLIERLQHHIYLSSSLIFLSAEPGDGKSTLLEQLSNKLPSNTHEAFIQLNAQMTEAQIRQQILQQLYENPLFDAQDKLLSSIYLLQEKQNNNTAKLIVIDNAEHLSNELLTELAELVSQKNSVGSDELNVLLLAGEASSREMFNVVNQRCACLEFKLEPLDKDESVRLLNHIFKQADYQHKVQHQDAVSQQLRSCQGVPKKIIALAEKIIAGKLTSVETSWLKLRLPAIALMLLLLAVAGGFASYLYPIFIKSDKQPEALENKPIQIESLASETVLPTNNEAIAQPQESEETEALAGVWKGQVPPQVENNDLQVGLDDIIAEQEILVLVAAEKLKIKPEQEGDEETQQTDAANIENTEVADTAASNKDEIENIKNNEEESVLVEEVITNKPEEDAIAEVIEQQPVVAKADSLFTPNSVLLAIPPSHYTLQLIAIGSEASLQRFMLQYKLTKEKVYVYRTVRSNKPLYIVTFGEYDSQAEAETASKALPGLLANLDSWVKKFQLVHRDLQLNNE